MTGPERDGFDRMIEQQLAGEPPTQSMVEEVNPWREPVQRVAWGLALTSVTLQFLFLQYLLPALGVVLQYLGFRALRKNGPAFRVAWVLSIVRLFWVGVSLALEAAPALPVADLDLAAGFTAMVVQIVQLLALRAGLRQVCRKAEIQPESDPLKSVVCWQVLVIVLAFSPLAHSWLTAIPMLIAFVCIVRALMRLGGALGPAGYCFTAAPVHLNAGTVKLVYLGLCFGLMLTVSAVANHPPLDAQPLPAAGETAIRQQLSDLGLPDEVLAELTDADVRALDGATHVACCAEMMSFSPDEQTMTLCDQTNNPQRPPVEPEIPAGVDTIIVSTYYIELPDYRIAVLNRFEWAQGSAGWGDAFLAAEDSDYGSELIGGQLLYDRKGTTYTAPIPDLQGQEATTNGFFGPQTSYGISGTVGYPLGAENTRGYLLYVMNLNAERIFGGTSFNYYHAKIPFHLPYRTPRERAGAWMDNRMSHYSNYNTALARADAAQSAS